jgi:hypothetical protein
VADSNGADSMIWFWFERDGDMIKRCRKIKRGQRARIGSMGMKRDMARRRGDIDRRRGGTGEGKVSR